MNRKIIQYLLIPALASVVAVASAVAQVNVAQFPISEVDGQPLPTLADVVSKVEAGIVNIAIETDSFAGSRFSTRERFERFFQEDNMFGPFFQFDDRPIRSRPRMNQGSGVIIDAERGHILTNQHLLVDGSQTKVTLSDGRNFDATLIGQDPDMDLALLKIDADNLSEVSFGDSDALRVGDFVLAIGNNYGLSATVTSGIVSALGRSGLGMDQYQEFIQTDAAINPGSSGGALINLRGEVIGINTAIFSPGGGSVGIGFAIPMNTAASIARQIQTYGRVKRGMLGIHFQELTEDLAKGFNYAGMDGVLISKVLANSAAAQAGLQEGDILTHFNDVKVYDGSQLRTLVALIRVGEQIDVGFMRDGQTLTGSGIIQDTSLQIVLGEDLNRQFAGAQFQGDQRLFSHGLERIVVISSVTEDSEAWELGLREGDVIVRVDRQPVETIEQFKDLIENRDSQLMLEILRSGNYMFVVVG